MIGDDEGENTKLFENGSLLGDLMQYVNGARFTNYFLWEILLVPLIHLTLSPTLDGDYLIHEFSQELVECTLEEVIATRSTLGFWQMHPFERLLENVGTDFQFDLCNAQDVERMIERNAIIEAPEDSIQNEGLRRNGFYCSL